MGTRDWRLGTEKEDKEDNNNSCTEAINRVSTPNSALLTQHSALREAASEASSAKNHRYS
ncbi:MAG: hypothetical protein V7L11_32195 [Nostoc sp.]|uniref:hypothetical protein n=1 Tax=Nostoc sp. TaxID=1180 RepID=UPI002FFC1AB0